MTTKDYQLAADRLNSFALEVRFKRIGFDISRLAASVRNSGVSVNELSKALRVMGKLTSK